MYVTGCLVLGQYLVLSGSSFAIRVLTASHVAPHPLCSRSLGSLACSLAMSAAVCAMVPLACALSAAPEASSTRQLSLAAQSRILNHQHEQLCGFSWHGASSLIGHGTQEYHASSVSGGRLSHGCEWGIFQSPVSQHVGGPNIQNTKKNRCRRNEVEDGELARMGRTA